MKTINVTFEDQEFELLETAKQDMSWREFILTLVTPVEFDNEPPEPADNMRTAKRRG